MYIGLHVKYPLFLAAFNGSWIFLTDLKKKNQISNFMKIRRVGNGSFHSDRHNEANSRFSQFSESARKGISLRQCCIISLEWKFFNELQSKILSTAASALKIWEYKILPDRLHIYHELHGHTYRKAVAFKSTALRTSSPTAFKTHQWKLI